MLLVGTTHGLHDLDTGEKLVDGMAVTALAPGRVAGSYGLLDRQFVVQVDDKAGNTTPAGELPEPDGQSLAILPDGTTGTTQRTPRRTRGRWPLACSGGG